MNQSGGFNSPHRLRVTMFGLLLIRMPFDVYVGLYAMDLPILNIVLFLFFDQRL